MQAKATFSVTIEVEVSLQQYNESGWTIGDLRKEVQQTALRRLATMVERETGIRFNGTPKINLIVTEST